MVFFFKQKTAYEMRISDWSSDVCSSDLLAVHAARARAQITANPDVGDLADSDRNAAARCRNGVPNLVDGTRAGIDADEVGFAATVIKIGANSEVGFFQPLAEPAAGNSEIGQLGRTGFDDGCFRLATAAVAHRHPRHPLQI